VLNFQHLGSSHIYYINCNFTSHHIAQAPDNSFNADKLLASRTQLVFQSHIFLALGTQVFLLLFNKALDSPKPYVPYKNPIHAPEMPKNMKTDRRMNHPDHDTMPGKVGKGKRRRNAESKLRFVYMKCGNAVRSRAKSKGR
jgi:hypothetical protein